MKHRKIWTWLAVMALLHGAQLLRVPRAVAASRPAWNTTGAAN